MKYLLVLSLMVVGAASAFADGAATAAKVAFDSKSLESVVLQAEKVGMSNRVQKILGVEAAGVSAAERAMSLAKLARGNKAVQLEISKLMADVRGATASRSSKTTAADLEKELSAITGSGQKEVAATKEISAAEQAFKRAAATGVEERMLEGRVSAETETEYERTMKDAEEVSGVAIVGVKAKECLQGKLGKSEGEMYARYNIAGGKKIVAEKITGISPVFSTMRDAYGATLKKDVNSAEEGICVLSQECDLHSEAFKKECARLGHRPNKG